MVVLLRYWRDRRGYSVRELARRAGVGYVTIVRIENDLMSPTVTMLRRICGWSSMTRMVFMKQT